MADATSTLFAGDRAGNYQILGLVGAGGMGVVYRALDPKLQRIVALKFLPLHLISNPHDKERFLREARTASALDHPNIGVIHGMEETGDGRSFIVMAYYEGETLAQKLLRGPLPVGEAVDIAIQMAHGLEEAHSHAIVHRDIKPSNVICTRQNLAKVVDFGLARVTTSASTQTLGTSGTVGYMSPEQTMGKSLDQRTDIWSLGVVIAEMATGRNPFQRDSAPACIVAILNESPSLPEDMPLELRRIVYHALSKDAATRYQSCREMLQDLDAFRSQLGPESKSSRAAGPKSASVSAAQFRDTVARASSPLLWSTTSQKQKLPAWLLSGATVAVLVAVLSFIPAVRDRVTGLFSHRQEHIAVLPLENVSNDPANQALSEGLMESLTGKLSNLDVGQQSLWVVPASEVRRRKIVDAADARKELGATLVVKGSITRQGDDIQLLLNLIDTQDLRQLGSISVEDRAGDLAMLQDEAVSKLAGMLHVNVTAEMIRDTGGSVAPAAYQSYLKALGYMQRYDKPGNLEQATGELESALKTDPRFAVGYAALGKAYQLKSVLDYDPKWTAEAEANCQRALQLNDKLPAAYITLGRIHAYAGKYDLAAQEFQHALDLNPRDADALGAIALTYEKAGRVADAEATFKKAIALRSDDWNGYSELGLFYDRQAKYPQAVEQFQHAIALTPDNAQAYGNLAAVYLDMGDAKDAPLAEAALKKSIELGPTYAAYANLGLLYSQQNRFAESAAMMEKALQLNDKNYEVWENLALAYERLNETDKAAAARERELLLVEAQLKAKPTSAELQSYLALLYGEKKLRDQAITHLQAALALGPDNQVVLENVGETYERLGDRGQAIKFMEKALQKGYPLESLKTNPALQGLLADPRFQAKTK
ncbi:MAG TPA: protein kinase [Terriglobales bacterium]|nr:protein kinase [Terriglobales bacterium]